MEAGETCRGVALSARHSGDFRVWRLHLRQGVRFQDGRPLDATAVLVNARRWRTSANGQALLPGLVAADGPRPDLVRFVFAAPMLDLPGRLSDPRLGLVSPGALQPESGAGAVLLRVAQSGSGPFDLARRARSSLMLRRNRGWWGSARGLGPALDRIAFRTVVSRADRLARLRSAAVRVAADVGTAAARRLRTDPVLTAVGVDSPNAIGLERSVHGIAGGGPAPLSGVWLSLIERR